MLQAYKKRQENYAIAQKRNFIFRHLPNEKGKLTMYNKITKRQYKSNSDKILYLDITGF